MARGWFRMVKSVWGNYIQVRQRRPDGYEETTAEVATAQEARRMYAYLSSFLSPLITLRELEEAIAQMEACHDRESSRMANY